MAGKAFQAKCLGSVDDRTVPKPLLRTLCLLDGASATKLAFLAEKSICKINSKNSKKSPNSFDNGKNKPREVSGYY